MPLLGNLSICIAEDIAPAFLLPPDACFSQHREAAKALQQRVHVTRVAKIMQASLALHGISMMVKMNALFTTAQPDTLLVKH